MYVGRTGALVRASLPGIMRAYTQPGALCDGADEPQCVREFFRTGFCVSSAMICLNGFYFFVKLSFYSLVPKKKKQILLFDHPSSVMV